MKVAWSILNNKDMKFTFLQVIEEVISLQAIFKMRSPFLSHTKNAHYESKTWNFQMIM